MNAQIRKRITEVLNSESTEDLMECVCPFFEKGDYPLCATCARTAADIDECKDFYLKHITTHPQDAWSYEFDSASVITRDTVGIDTIIGIGIKCDTCYIYDKCPLYRIGYSCAIKWDSDRPKTPSEFMDFIINTQYERVKRSAVFEKLDGGVPDAGLSGEMDRLTNYLAIKNNMGRDRLSISVEASGDTVSTGGGILSKIFGGSKELPDKSDTVKTIDVKDFEELSVPAKSERTD